MTAARVWIKRNQELLRLSDEGVENLDLITEAPLGESGAASVLFRQRTGFGAAALRGPNGCLD